MCSKNKHQWTPNYIIPSPKPMMGIASEHALCIRLVSMRGKLWTKNNPTFFYQLPRSSCIRSTQEGGILSFHVQTAPPKARGAPEERHLNLQRNTWEHRRYEDETRKCTAVGCDRVERCPENSEHIKTRNWGHLGARALWLNLRV